MPTKRQFDMVIATLVAWHLFKGLAKAVAARHAASDSGIASDVAQAAELAL